MDERDIARFWSKVDRSGDCWLWQAVRKSTGYGTFFLTEDGRQRTWRAHRLAWHLTHGPIPEGMIVRHGCDNPPCCNPAHLLLGTQLDNARDRNGKQRQARGERAGRVRLTAALVIGIRAAANDGVPLGDLARTHGVHHATIWNIVKGRNWRHLL